MAISESILNKINELSITDEEKQLLKDLLKYQERGNRQYTNEYMEYIKKYLENKKK